MGRTRSLGRVGCIVGAVAITSGCGGRRSDGAPVGDSPTEATDSGTGGNASGHSGSNPTQQGDDATSTTDPAPSIFDVGTPLDIPKTEPGCDKVDFVFVIDHSESMADEQGSLADSVPGFISGIKSTLTEVDGFHVGVVATNVYARNPEACRIMGAFVTQTGGPDSSAAQCGPFVEGGSYMTEADAFDHTFTCAAKLGTGGDGNEKPIDALRAALSPELNGPGGCNEGFLRDDALLVVVLITDEEDDHEAFGPLEYGGSQGDPPQWYADVVAVKGNADNVAVLSLIGHASPNACPDFQWDGFEGAEISVRLAAWTDLFTNGFIGDVCAPEYGAFFEEALAVVDTACDGFTPPAG